MSDQNTQHTSPSNPNQNQQHAYGGAVQVRGMIRRIWRPRYLEIDDDGVLRYYEAAADSPRTGTGMVRGVGRDISQEMQAFSLPDLQIAYANSNPNSKSNNNGSGSKSEIKVAATSPRESGEGLEVELEHVMIPPSHQDEGSTSTSMNHVESWDEIKRHGSAGAISSSSSEKISDESIHEKNSVENLQVKARGSAGAIATSSPKKKYSRGKHEGTTTPKKQHPPKVQTIPRHHIHSHRPKSTMTILSARMINVASLRDIHVGLPKGSHGFVFCGRQIFDDSLHNSGAGDIDIDNGNGNGSRTGLGGYLNDVNAGTDDQFEIRDDICHPLSILSNVDNDYFDSSRDYLCSVETEEEAKNWVQKLKWAAHQARNKSRAEPLLKLQSMVPPSMLTDRIRKDSGLSLNENEISIQGSFDGKRLVRSPPISPIRRSAFGGVNFRPKRTNSAKTGSSGVLDDLVMDEDHYLSDIAGVTSILSDSTISAQEQEGFTIVTRVRGFRVRQLGRKRILGFNSEIVYEIQMLLLNPGHLISRSKKREQEGKKHENTTVSQWTVEQKTVIRSLDDAVEFLTAFAQLQKDNSSTKSSAPSELDIVLKDIRYSRERIGIMSSIDAIHNKLKKGVESIDGALRNVTSDPALCNTKMAKEFLGLMTENGEGATDDVKSQQLLIVVGESVDTFVKEWLVAREANKIGQKEKIRVYALLMFRHLQIEVFAYAILISITKAFFQKWYSKLFTYKLNIRLDIMLVIMGTSYYFGHIDGQSKRKLHARKSYTDEKVACKPKTVTKRKDAVRDKNDQRKQVLDEDECSDEDNAEYGTHSMISEDDDESLSNILSSPLPQYQDNEGTSCWSRPDDRIFNVRGKTYLKDRIKLPSAPSPFKCRGVDLFLTDNPERNISRLPCVLGGKLAEEDTFMVNFLLPFGNFVSYFSVSNDMPENVAKVWKKFINGDQMYRDARFKLLPVVVEGPWIVKKAVGPGTAPALLSQSIPLQYYFTHPADKKKGIYEVDVIITASKIAKGILSVVKSHTKRLTIGMAFIIEAATEDELPETVLASCQLHSLHLELCPQLPKYYLPEEFEEDDGHSSQF